MKTSITKDKHQALPHHRWRPLALLALVGSSISACGAPAQTPAQTLTPASAPMQDSLSLKTLTTAPVNTQALRVIVKFKQAVPYRDAGFLQELSRETGMPMSYISSVSADTHVYRVETQAGQRQADILQRLTDIPVVQYAEADAVARRQ